MSGPPAPRGPRPRALGVRIGALDPGPANAITDVAGVRVGHVTVWRDEPGGRGIARTGVTAILPGPPETLFAEPVPAGAAVLNGAGEMTGFVGISEWGVIETTQLTRPLRELAEAEVLELRRRVAELPHGAHRVAILT